MAIGLIPLASGLTGLVFGFLLFRRAAARGGAHHVVWGIGMLLYAVGGLCEAATTALGWEGWVFRVWYITGAVLSAAWLGQGTVYLLVKRSWVHALTAALAAASVYAAIRVATATLDSSLAIGELTGKAIVTPGVRTLTPFFNVYGTLALVGGAIASAVMFLRKKVLGHRVVGNVLIAVGALMPAVGGSMSRLGVRGLLYVFELVGIALMFVGFLRATLSSGPARER